MVITDHGVQVINSRQYVQAVSPNAAGNGWNYIVGLWTSGPSSPVEWVVIKNFTTSPTVATYFTANHAYPNITYGWLTGRGQLRAPNGRIIFLLFGNTFACYDPTTEAVTQFGDFVESPPIDPNASTIPYSAAYDTSGKLYIVTQESQNRPACVVMVDTDALTSTVLGYVGSNALGFTTYGYYNAPDTGTANKYVYVAYGENPWQLWALNITPGPNFGVATKLFDAPSTGFISFINVAGKGWVADIHSNLGNTPGFPADVHTQLWCLDGATYPYTAGVDPPGGLARNVTPLVGTLTSPPDIDYNNFYAGVVDWRPNGSSAPYSRLQYPMQYMTPVAIESLVPTYNGIAGNTQSYNGVFRRDQPSDTLTWYRPWGNGVSEPVALRLNGKIYWTGYPNGQLSEFDPAQPWVPGVNPKTLGNFGLNGTQFAGIKYSRRMKASQALNRLYCAGDRERNGIGMGIGYYDFVKASFGGTYSLPGMTTEHVTGLVVDDRVDRVVVAAFNTTPGKEDGALYCFDRKLSAVTKWFPLRGVANLGQIHSTTKPGVICGVVQSGSKTIVYQYDVIAGAVVGHRTLGITGAVGPVTTRSDGSLWTTIGNAVVQIDTNTLAATTIADATAAAPVTQIAFGSDDNTLWFSGGSLGANLYSVTVPAIPVPPLPPMRGAHRYY